MSVRGMHGSYFGWDLSSLSESLLVSGNAKNYCSNVRLVAWECIHQAGLCLLRWLCWGFSGFCSPDIFQGVLKPNTVHREAITKKRKEMQGWLHFRLFLPKRKKARTEFIQAVELAEGRKSHLLVVNSRVNWRLAGKRVQPTCES